MTSAPLVSASFISWAAGMLIHATWIGALAGLVVECGLIGTRHPAWRHAWAMGGFAAIALGLILAAVLTWPGFPRLAPAETSTATLVQSGTEPAGSPLAAAPPAVGQRDHAAAPRAPAWRDALVMSWILGVLLCAVRHVHGFSTVARLRRASTPAPPVLVAAFMAQCRTLGISAPGLRLSAQLEVPVVIGWWRPLVLFPLQLLTSLPSAQLEALLMHELAHVRRHDALIALAVSSIESLLYFHPAVWRLSRVLREAREHCCDQLALAGGVAPDSLARALLALAQHDMRVRSPALAANGGALAVRVRRILGVPEQRLGWMRGLAATVTLSLSLTLAIACSARPHTGAAEASSPHAMASYATLPTPDPTMPKATADQDLRMRTGRQEITVTLTTLEAATSVWNALGIHTAGALFARQYAAVEAFCRMDDTGTIRANPFPAMRLRSYGAMVIDAGIQSTYTGDLVQVDGRMAPVTAVLTTGPKLTIRVHADEAGNVILDHFNLQVATHLGTEELAFPGLASGDDRPPVCSEPVVAVSRAVFPACGLRVGPGEVLALPMAPPVLERVHAAHARQTLGPCAPVHPFTITDDIADRLARRTVVFLSFTVAALPPLPPRFASESTRLDGVVVSLQASNAPFKSVLRQLAEQLPLATVAEFDSKCYQPPVSITVTAAPLRDVIERLLAPTLLEAVERGGFLVIRPLQIPGEDKRVNVYGFDGYIAPRFIYRPPWVSNYQANDILPADPP